MRIERTVQRLVAHVVLIVACLLALFPLFWVVLTSIKRNVDANSPSVNAFAFTPTLQNYADLFNSPVFLHAALTTAVTTAGTTLGSVLVGTLTAYGLGRLWVFGRRVLVGMMVLLQVVPFLVLIVPLFNIVSAVGLYDTWIGLIVVQVGLFTPFVTWLMLAFFRSVPVEVEEAAFVDGVNRYQLFRYVLVPMLAPGLVAAGIFTAIASWNSFLLPVVLGQTVTQTLTAFAATFASSEQLLWAQMCATAVVILAPIVIFTLIMQRPLVNGITAGSLKS
ncbi:sugar ABC transporter permease [Frondihabitans sucicola]|uniref:Sugar ABC transporter permease n=1 Tax=Frondihabitans sucicola TaxID=1268041 RepID=A0ABN6XZN2_9MICO|nr:carbohydrate ABC transporter permease [Frondihabitans sucicola]BDZ48863.1 sugar ABC transporter permease [Frondihabitans sucicola]